MKANGEGGEGTRFRRGVAHDGCDDDGFRRDAAADGDFAEAIASGRETGAWSFGAEHEDMGAAGCEEAESALETIGILAAVHFAAGTVAWAENAAAESEDGIGFGVSGVRAPRVAILEGAHEGIGYDGSAEYPEEGDREVDENAAAPAKGGGEQEEGSAERQERDGEGLMEE